MSEIRRPSIVRYEKLCSLQIAVNAAAEKPDVSR